MTRKQFQEEMKPLTERLCLAMEKLRWQEDAFVTAGESSAISFPLCPEMVSAAPNWQLEKTDKDLAPVCFLSPRSKCNGLVF